MWLLDAMIPIVVCHDQVRNERMAFNEPVYSYGCVATDLDSQVLDYKTCVNFFLTVLNVHVKSQNLVHMQDLSRQIFK